MPLTTGIIKKCIEEASKSSDEAVRNTAMAALNNATTALKEAIEANTEHTLNLGSPAQVGELFYDILKIPFSGEKKSVAKSQVKALLNIVDSLPNLSKFGVVFNFCP